MQLMLQEQYKFWEFQNLFIGFSNRLICMMNVVEDFPFCAKLG